MHIDRKYAASTEVYLPVLPGHAQSVSQLGRPQQRWKDNRNDKGDVTLAGRC